MHRFRFALLATSVLLIVASFLSFNKSKPKPLKFSGQVVYTVQLEKEQTALGARTSWWHEYLEFPENRAFLDPLLDGILEGGIRVSEPVFPFEKTIPADDAKMLINQPDSFLDIPDDPWAEPVYRMAFRRIRAEDVVSITFNEDWSYDESKLELTKSVRGIVLNVMLSDPETGMPFLKPLVYIPFDASGAYTGTGNEFPVHVPGFTYDHASPEKLSSVNAILSSMQSVASNPKTGLYDTLYPYNKKLDKKEKVFRQPLIAKANHLRFMENWFIDPAKRIFVKKVSGVAFTDLQDFEREGRPVRNISRSAFLPLNGYEPVPMKRDNRLHVDSISYSIYYWGFGNIVDGEFLRGDTSGVAKFQDQLLDLVEQKKIKTYLGPSGYRLDDPFAPGRVPATAAEIDRMTVSYDTVLYENPDDPEHFATKILERRLRHDAGCGFSFYETWDLDASTMRCRKNVKTIGTLIYGEEYSGNYFAKEFFHVDPNPVTDTAALLRPEYLVQSHIRIPVRIEYGDRESNENMYSELMIDYPNSAHYFQHIMPSKRYRFMSNVMDNALSGKLAIYRTENLSAVMTPQELRAKLDSMSYARYANTDLNPDYPMIQMLVFDEDWYFNPATQQFLKTVNTITFAYRSQVFIEDYSYGFYDMPLFTVIAH
jgi:hypothetical protein